MKSKGKNLPIPYYPDEKQFSNLEAVKQGVFTAFEMIAVIECFRDNLTLLFHVLDRPGASSEELIERLGSFKNHYLVRWDKLAPHEKPLYHHQYQKLMDYLDKRLWDEQKKVFSSLQNNSSIDLPPPPNSDYQPLKLKDIALIYGCSTKTMSRRIKKFKEESKFDKKESDRYFSVSELQVLETLLDCSFSKESYQAKLPKKTDF